MSELSSGKRLPFPGLRSFQRDETDLFFGRENSVNHMIRRLAGSRFLAVLGASGSGKSSLVRTGLLDGLELGLLAQAGSWWRVVDIRPGGEPLRNLARGLCGEGADEADVEQMRAFLLRGPRSIVQWASTNLAKGENLLLLVDQFEELFRYQHYEGRQEAEAFVGLLIESARNRDQPIYVTLTMRSEFLGACALFGGLAEAMNDGQYLTPRMTREQCREAIEGPAAVCGFKIEPALVNRLLNDLSDFAPWDDRKDPGPGSQLDSMVRRADQLPLLQHALNRLWIKAASESGDVVLKLADYDALGGLRGALNQHAQEIMDELGPARAPLVEQIFRALTVGTNIADAVRRPTRLAELVAITGAPRDEVVAVCEAFRATGRNFLMPPPEVPLRDDTFIDISHESLIRQWSDLSSWLEKEARDADAMRRLGAAASLAEAGGGDLLRGRELANLETWRGESKLPNAWATRYVAKPEAAFSFLDQSVEARKAYEARTVEAKHQAQRASRVRWAAIAGAGLILAGIGGYSLLQRSQVAELRLEQAKTAEQKAIAEAAAEEATVQAKQAEEQRVLAEQQRVLAEEQRVKAEAAAEEARKATDQATAAQARLDAQKTQIEQTIQAYVAGSIDKQQRASELAGSADLLAALARQLPIDKLPAHIVDRLAWQSAAESASGFDPTRLTAVARPLSAPSSDGTPRAYELWRQTSDEDVMLVVDRATGGVTDRFEIESDEAGSGRLKSFVSADGKAALVVADNGRLYRWSSGQPNALRVLDTRWVKQENAGHSRDVTSAAFDTKSGDMAVLFNEYDTGFVAVIPPENADQAVIWPLHRLAGDQTYVDAELIALAEGRPLLGFKGGNRWSLSRFNPATKQADRSAWTSSYLSAFQMPGGQIRVKFESLACNDDRPPEVGVAVVICAADRDLATGREVGETVQIPILVGSATSGASNDYTRGIAIIADSTGSDDGWTVGPQDGSRAKLVSADGRPSWLLDPDGTAGAHDLVSVAFWRRILPLPEIGSQTKTRVTTTQGFATFSLVGSAEIQDIQREGTMGSDPDTGSWGSLGSPQLDPVAKLDTTSPMILVDGTGKGVAAFSNRRLSFYAGNKWHETAVTGDSACVRRLENAGAQTGAATDKSADTGLGYTAMASSVTAPEFLLLFNSGNAVARLTFAPKPAAEAKDGQPAASAYEARLECPEGAVADSVAAVDFDGGRVALNNSQTGRLGILKGSTFTTIATLQGESASFAAFAGDTLAVVTDKDRLLAIATGQSPQLVRAIANPLPGAEGIYATKDSLALVRTERNAALDEWLSVAVVGLDAATQQRGQITHAGFLPFGFKAIDQAQLREGGRFDVMTGQNLFKFELPAVAPIGRLVGALEPLSDQRGLDTADQSLLGLLASAMTVEGSANAKPLATIPYARCALALYRWQEGFANDEGLDADIAESGTLTEAQVRTTCADVDWPTASAALDLRESRSVNQAWPRPASQLLAQAVAGDSFALRSLLGWANRTPSREVRGRGAESLLIALYPAFNGRWSEPATIPGYFEGTAGSVDPYAHLAIARTALAEGSAASLKKAALHFAIAERVLLDGGSVNLVSSATASKIAVAKRISASDRADVEAAIAAWTPVAPATSPAEVSSDLKTRVRQDIARLGELSAKAGNAVGFDLLRLHLLLRLNDIADDAERPQVQAELTGLLLNRKDWPSIDIGGENELVSAFERAADSAPDELTANRLRLAGIRLLEHAGQPLDLGEHEDQDAGAIYARLLEKLVAAGQEKVAAAAADFEFGKRAYNFGSVRWPAPKQADWTYAVLGDRMALAQFLLPRTDAQAAYAQTLFWRAANRNEHAYSDQLNIADAEKKALKDALPAMYREAFVALGKLPQAGAAMSPDDMVVFATAVNWAANDRFEYKSDADALPPEFDQAMTVSDALLGLGERGAWQAVWTRPPGEGSLALNDSILRETQLGPQEERPFQGPDMAAYAQRLRNLELGSRRARIVTRGGIDANDDAEMSKRYSNGPAYALAFVVGHQAGASRFPASTECDRLASHEADPERRAPGRIYTVEAMARAYPVCDAAVAANPADKTSQYVLARSLSDIPERAKERLDILLALAASDYTAAFNNLTATAEDKSVDAQIRRVLSEAYTNRIFRDHFTAAFEGFDTLPPSPTKDIAIQWMAEYAAERGSSDANLYLAMRATDPAEKAFRFMAAAASKPDMPSTELANLNAEADRILETLNDADRSLVQGRLAAYRPQRFILTVTPEIEQVLRAEPTTR